MEPSKMKRIHNYQTVQGLLCQPLMIDARALPMLVDEARLEFGGKRMDAGEMPPEPTVNITLYEAGIGGDELMALGEADTSGRAPGSLIAVVPLSGIVTRHGYQGWFSSAPGTLEIGRYLKALDNDESIGAIVMSIDSPGGQVTGTPELSQILYDIRKAGRTKTVAVVDALMASAASYIGTAAEKVFCIGSGDCGSIGVVSSYSDYSKYLEKIGIQTEYFRIPAKKARFTGSEPLDEDMRKTIADGIEKCYEEFVRDMARNRNVSESHVKEKFGQGEMLSAKASVEAGLIDGIASIDEVLMGLAVEAQSRKKDYARKRAAMQLEQATAMQIDLPEGSE
jgi:signal peptide peptidase SppA